MTDKDFDPERGEEGKREGIERAWKNAPSWLKTLCIIAYVKTAKKAVLWPGKEFTVSDFWATVKEDLQEKYPTANWMDIINFYSSDPMNRFVGHIMRWGARNGYARAKTGLKIERKSKLARQHTRNVKVWISRGRLVGGTCYFPPKKKPKPKEPPPPKPPKPVRRRKTNQLDIFYDFKGHA